MFVIYKCAGKNVKKLGTPLVDHTCVGHKRVKTRVKTIKNIIFAYQTFLKFFCAHLEFIKHFCGFHHLLFLKYLKSKSDKSPKKETKLLKVS